ncbi:MAG: hypothetical protein ACFCVK_15925 [Acidimicrobiales bacterium]
MSRSGAGLVDLWVETQVAQELARALEAADVADRGHESRRGGEVDSRHGEQELNRAVLEGGSFDDLVETLELFAQELELAKARRHCLSLVIGQLDTIEPAQPLDPEQVRRTRSLNQIAVQHSVDLVLQSRALTHEQRSAAHPAAGQTLLLRTQPHLREEPRAQKLGTSAGVEVVGLGWRRPTTTAGSKPIVKVSACPTIVLPGNPGPGENERYRPRPKRPMPLSWPYNTHRPHRSLEQQPPTPNANPPRTLPATVTALRTTRCDGLIHGYRNAA